MSELIDTLPGIDLPVGDVSRELSKMWGGHAENALTEFRASQMNLILHFGRKVDFEDAKKRFEVAVRFAQRYPSRIIVLCPFIEEGQAMRAKLYSQCFIGDSHREMCCCEALMLGFTSEDNGYLFNQVSVWLESDLPTYHWFSEVRSSRIEKYFHNLLLKVNRIAYDSNIESEDYRNLNWPQPEKVVDLARARLLPVRQAIGQYLSGFDMHLLKSDLVSIEVQCIANRQGEANHLMEWLVSCLGVSNSPKVSLATKRLPLTSEHPFSFELKYEEGRFLKWESSSATRISQIRHTFFGSEKQVAIRIKPLAPEQELSEVFYF